MNIIIRRRVKALPVSNSKTALTVSKDVIIDGLNYKMNFVYLVLNFCVLIIKSQHNTVEPLYNDTIDILDGRKWPL